LLEKCFSVKLESLSKLNWF